jgi:hypothetical protein
MRTDTHNPKHGFSLAVWRIWFEKGGGDLGLSAGLPHLRIHEYSAARGAPTSSPSFPCFFEPLDKLGDPNSPHGCMPPNYLCWKGDAKATLIAFNKNISDFELNLYTSEHVSLRKGC